MSVIHEAASQVQWNEGEEEMHRILRVPHRENPSSPFLTPNGANLLMRCPLLALGTLDSQGRPWTTLIGGEAGFSRPIAQSIIGIKTLVDRAHDPVVETLLGADADGEPVRIEGNGKMVSGLAIDLENRRRVKIYGRMVGGALAATTPGVGEVQVVVKIEQSLGRFDIQHSMNAHTNTLTQVIAQNISIGRKSYLKYHNLNLYPIRFHFPSKRRIC